LSIRNPKVERDCGSSAVSSTVYGEKDEVNDDENSENENDENEMNVNETMTLTT